MKRPELTGISPEALNLLVAYDWPGNVRQLQSVVRQSLLSTTGTVIGPANLPDFVRNPGARYVPSEKAVTSSSANGGVALRHELAPVAAVVPPAAASIPQAETPSERESFSLDKFIEDRLASGSSKLYDEVLEQVERRLFARVLAETGGNQSRTSEILGITRGKVRDRIAAFGIHMDRTISIDD
jgi:DNA-binding NtrC family response regulator